MADSAPTPESDAIREAIGRSSLGTPEAQALRATVSDEHAAQIVARAKELEQQSETVEFTADQIDRLGHWLSECLDDAAPLNERARRSSP